MEYTVCEHVFTHWAFMTSLILSEVGLHDCETEIETEVILPALE
jgi:hypothetical protein